jgi:hypothetical protein
LVDASSLLLKTVDARTVSYSACGVQSFSARTLLTDVLEAELRRLKGEKEGENEGEGGVDGVNGTNRFDVQEILEPLLAAIKELNLDFSEGRGKRTMRSADLTDDERDSRDGGEDEEEDEEDYYDESGRDSEEESEEEGEEGGREGEGEGEEGVMLDQLILGQGTTLHTPLERQEGSQKEGEGDADSSDSLKDILSSEEVQRREDQEREARLFAAALVEAEEDARAKVCSPALLKGSLSYQSFATSQSAFSPLLCHLNYRAHILLTDAFMDFVFLQSHPTIFFLSLSVSFLCPSPLPFPSPSPSPSFFTTLSPAPYLLFLPP